MLRMYHLQRVNDQVCLEQWMHGSLAKEARSVSLSLLQTCRLVFSHF